ncbi:MAG TPA: DUF2147 domain-containing protein [Caulobacteraceae bacterium]|nr:DUF2147 domain-containing protein [Caulobacteraceae bacterium]
MSREKRSWPFAHFLAASLGALAWVGIALAAPDADPAEGVWLTAEGDAQVKIAPCAAPIDQLCGTIVWLRDPLDERGQPVRDAHNPRPELRSRQILGLELIRGLRQQGAGHWTGGQVYNPDNGKSYRVRIQVTSQGALRIEGCLLLFCSGETWRRVS